MEGDATFLERCEYKYILDPETRAALEDEVRAILPPDVYSGGKEYTISSVYFDDPHRRLYYQTLDREPYRYKLRLRVYGDAKRDSTSFFEIKSKYLGRSQKRRLCLSLGANERLWLDGTIPDDLPAEERKLAGDIIRLIRRDDLSPSAVVSYERLAFAGTGEERLRVTFDSALRIRTGDLDLTRGSGGERAMPDGMTVLEIKSGRNLPLAVTRLIGKYGLKNVSYSKYGQTVFNSRKDIMTWTISQEFSEVSDK